MVGLIVQERGWQLISGKSSPDLPYGEDPISDPRVKNKPHNFTRSHGRFWLHLEKFNNMVNKDMAWPEGEIHRMHFHDYSYACTCSAVLMIDQ